MQPLLEISHSRSFALLTILHCLEFLRGFISFLGLTNFGMSRRCNGNFTSNIRSVPPAKHLEHVWIQIIFPNEPATILSDWYWGPSRDMWYSIQQTRSRITMVLARNSDGSHILPVRCVGSVTNLRCFRSKKYVSQRSRYRSQKMAGWT